MMKINNSSSTPSEPERIACILRYDGGSRKRCHTYTSDAASPFIGSKMQKASDNPFRLGSYYAQRAAPPREKNSCKFRCDRGSAKRCHTAGSTSGGTPGWAQIDKTNRHKSDEARFPHRQTSHPQVTTPFSRRARRDANLT